MGRDDAEKLWEIASDLARRPSGVSLAGDGAGRSLPPLLFFTDPGRTPRPWETAARLPGGSGVVFRHFGLPGARETAQRLREATRSRGVRLLVGRDAELALEVQADGIHLPEAEVGRAGELRRSCPDWLITAASHGPIGEELEIDAWTLSPVFPAGGASAARPALGVARFRQLVEQAARPVYALGGITAATAGRLRGSGACGLAAIGAVQAAFGPS